MGIGHDRPAAVSHLTNNRVLMYFVFRNNTIERFFPKDCQFSGYDDVSAVPSEAEGYIWFYQMPVKYDQELLAAEIGSYSQKLDYVLREVAKSKTVVALTMEWLYAVALTDDDHRVRMAVDGYNKALAELADTYPQLKVIDFGEFTRRYPVEELTDWKFYFISQMGLNPRLSKDFKAWFARKMEGIALKRKKCLVLDLDNTLWSGVLGEDGIDGIRIGGDYPGKAFLYFQEALLELGKAGVVLTVCSKNDERDVLDVWEQNPYLVLRKEHFAAYRINWQDKATNIREIAEELNIGMDSMVFVDDSPAERELVRQMLPMVEVPEFPEQPYGLPLFFQKLVEDYFRIYTVTDEDRAKTQQYKANASRAMEQRQHTDLSEFLRSLEIRLTIEEANEFNIQRIAQMTQKTNQFNLTTRRYTDADIRRLLQEGSRIWCLSVADKFGDSGITGCLILDGFEIDTLLLSCRVLGKGIENAFVKAVMSILRKEGLQTLAARYVPTLKNGQTKDFYESLGFSVARQEPDGAKCYELALAEADLETEGYYEIILKN
jgi:FkbH-like protein